MGTWGTGLYANDTTKDVRDDYIELLKDQKSTAEALAAMLQKDYGSFPEDQALFWYALADTQWEYGRLDPTVQEKALAFCAVERDFDRWQGAAPGKAEAWDKTIAALAEKLRSPQPPEKKVRPWRSYRCPWRIGDVFAYRLHAGPSVEHGCAGKYIAFWKVSEAVWYPRHVNPIVYIPMKIWDELPTLEQVTAEKPLPSLDYPSALEIRKHIGYSFAFLLITTMKRQVPEKMLTLIGNQVDGIPEEQRTEENVFTCSQNGWEGTRWNHTIERSFFEQYFQWKDASAAVYDEYAAGVRARLLAAWQRRTQAAPQQ